MYKILYLPTGEYVEKALFSDRPALNNFDCLIYYSTDGIESSPTRGLWCNMQDTETCEWATRKVIPKHLLEIIEVN